MSDSSDLEETKVKACAVIGAHEIYNSKFGATSAGIIIASIVMALFQKSFWPFAIGVVVSFVVSYFIRLSCYRRVERATGLPRFAQDQVLALYKRDNQFAAGIDHALNEAGRSIIRENESSGSQYSPERLSQIVSSYPSVDGEITARETVFRLDFDDERRRQIMPFHRWGREFMQREEFDIWKDLSQGTISDTEAIERITDLMEKYYGMVYPLKHS
jgi:hypothetical protein